MTEEMQADAVSAPIESNKESLPVSNEIESSVIKQEITGDNLAVAKDENLPKEEKSYKRDEVNKIVATEKARAAEKARQQLLAELEENQRRQNQFSQNGQYAGNQHAINAQSQNIQPFLGTQEDVIRVTDARLAQLQQHQQQAFIENQRLNAQKEIVTNFLEKIDSAKIDDPLLSSKIDELGLYDKIPTQVALPIAKALGEMDNIGDIISDLYENPAKLAAIASWSTTSPAIVSREIAKLSASIKANKQAKAAPVANAPLRQISPSLAPSPGNGEQRVADLIHSKECQW